MDEFIINKLINDTNLLIEVLTEFGFCNITKNSREIRCSYSQDSNPTSVRIKLDTLYCDVYSKNIHGSIFKLLSTQSGENYQVIRQILADRVGGIKTTKKPKRKLFCGVFENNYEVVLSETYPMDTLNKYEDIPSLKFYKDNIWVTTQKFFGIRYDNRSNRIIIPWIDEGGFLIGTMGRYNYQSSENIAKYMTMDRFNKRFHLFGLNRTQKFIDDERLAYVVESEKSVMKLFQMGYKNSVAIGSHSISEYQARKLKIYADKVVVLFDEELSEDEIVRACKSFEDFNEVYYVYDCSKKYLTEGSKDSPADLNKETFEKILTECTKKYK